MLGGNENMQKGTLAKALQRELYSMIDSIITKVRSLKFYTYDRGKEQIDSIWTSKDFEAKKAAVFSFFLV